jgi:endogenous inhibitor of DNA gyrase (YacG/DUF329 family)
MYKLVEKNCIYCNINFLGSIHRKYCGYKCSKDARKKRVNLNCQNCNKEFEVQEWSKNSKFCSMECKVKSQTSDMIKVTCDNCSKEFKRKEHKLKNGKHKFCSKKCSDTFNTGSNHYEWKEHLHDKNLKLALKQWSLKIKERDGYTCQLCGETNKSILEAHHMKHRSKFPELQFDFNNGITLCLSCHALQHLDDPKSLRLIKYKIAKNR